MTDELRAALEQLKALCDAATPGPWRYWNKAGEPYCDVFGNQGTLPPACTGVLIGGLNRVSADAADNELIAKMRNAAPALIDFALTALTEIGDHDWLCETMRPYRNRCQCGQDDLQAAAERLMEGLK